MKTVDAARGKWHGILPALGVDEKYLVDRHGPCPLGCGGKVSFRWDNKGGDGTWICTHCGAGNPFQLLEKINGWPFPKAALEVDRVTGNVEVAEKKAEMTDEQKKDSIKRVLQKAHKLKPGDPAWLYLERRCGTLPETALTDLRCHPGMIHPSGDRYPCLLAVIRNPDRSGASVHRTFLTQEGQKAPVEPVKMVMPGNIKGAAIMLGAPGEQMGITEGVETALCARAMFGGPVWAAISAGNMVAWVPPPEARRIIVYGDNDTNFTGQHAAYATAKKLKALGLSVLVDIPKQEGADWANVWELESLLVQP